MQIDTRSPNEMYCEVRQQLEESGLRNVALSEQNAALRETITEHEDQIEFLIRENAALRERLDSVLKSHFSLSKDCVALREDKARLDWLDHRSISRLDRVMVHMEANKISVRSAIDAARKEAQP